MTPSPEPEAPPIITVFRSRLRPESGPEYDDTARHMEELARTVPGFVDFKTFTAHDGERVSIVTFASADTHRSWRDHPEHRRAQRLGRERFYASYDIAVCEVTAERHFTA